MLAKSHGGINTELKDEPIKYPYPLAQSAVMSSPLIPAPIGNTAPRLVSMKGVSIMDKSYFDALTGYKNAMLQAKQMLQQGLVTCKEYAIIETKMCEKYCINSCSLYRDNDLINTPFRVNISPTKEVL